MKKPKSISMSTWMKIVDGRTSQIDVISDIFEIARSDNPKSEKRFRGYALYNEVAGLRRLIESLDWHGDLVLSQRGVFVVEEGVWFDATTDDRFFWKTVPVGRKSLKYLEKYVKDPRVIIDIGANVGTIALYLAKRFPRATVYAFEASSETVEQLKANLRAQPSPMENVVVVHEAVSDRAGEVRITRSMGTLNHLVGLGRGAQEPGEEVEVVKANSLSHYVDRFGLDHIDFLKINIEGSEPLLADDIVTLADRISTMYIEFSTFSDFEKYEAMFHRFRAAGFHPFLHGGHEILDIAQFCRERFETAAAVMIWFVKKDLL